jgi:TRAP-type mannitol/chloroaromatic compound transport system substrate-binding protein
MLWERTAKDLMAASQGALDITVHSAGAVIPGTQEFDGVDKGLIDIGTTCTMYWVDKFGPVANLFTYQIAGLSPMESVMWHTIEGNKFLQDIIDAGGYNVQFIGGIITVPEMFLAMKKPLKSLADLRGTKIRTAGDDGVCFSKMGVSVIFMASAEVVDAMLKGIIDGCQLSSPAMDYSLHTYESVKYNYLGPVRQPCEWLPIMVNKKTWAALPDGLKVLLTEMGKGAALNYYTHMSQADLVAVKAFRAKGVSVEMIPKDIESELMRQAEILYADYSAKDPAYKKVYDSITTFQKTYRDTWPRM